MEMMTAHKTETREDWLAARLDLLEAEKALTRHSDEMRPAEALRTATVNGARLLGMTGDIGVIAREPRRRDRS